MNKKILLAEPNFQLNRQFSSMLKKHNYQVISVYDGIKGLKKTFSEKPDCIITNLHLPIMNGLEMMEAVKEFDKYELMPFIFLAEANQNEQTRNCMNLGGDDFLYKPFTERQLIQSIEGRLKKVDHIQNYVNKIKTNLLKNIPHELRSPLFVIRGYIEIMLQDYPHLDPVDVIDYLGEIQHSSGRLADIVEKFFVLLDLELREDSVIQENKTGCMINHNIISGFLSETIYIKDRIDDITIDVESSLLPICYRYLSLLITELLSNSCKFSIPGSRISLNGKSFGDKYLLSVLDNGIGIGNNDLRNIDLFTQFNREEYQQNGIGMGLSIIQKIITAIGGNIIIDSKPDQFFEVKITFPLLQLKELESTLISDETKYIC